MHNTVTANLLMMSIIVLGFISAFTIKKEVFPEAALDMVSVSVIYRGAAPEEVEEGVCVKVEEAVQDVDGVKRITSTAQENVGSVTIEVKSGYDVSRVMEDIKSRVDAIDTFPEETEKPVVNVIVRRVQVINIAISGQTDRFTLKNIAEDVREDLLNYKDITQVSVTNTQPYEIAIEVSENALQRYNLTFDDVAAAIRKSSIDLPGGSVKTKSGEILIRTKGQAYTGAEFENIVVRSFADGTRLYLKDVAHIVDGFTDTDLSAKFDGEPSSMVQVFRVGEESALKIADIVYQYVLDKKEQLPQGIKLTTWQDDTLILKSRMDLLFKNGIMGLVLVFIALALFLKLKLAGWVSVGLVISFMGTLWLIPEFNVSINLISLFAFIVVLGIVVDDAIIVGENIYSKIESGMHPIKAAVEGASSVAVPVIFAVLTSFAAFAPLMLVEGMFGKFMRAIPIVVITTLGFSLIESLLILPAHLAHLKFKNKKELAEQKVEEKGWWDKIQSAFSDKLQMLIERSYKPSLKFAIKWRYATLAVGVVMLMLTFALSSSGWVKFSFFPAVDADNVVTLLTMPQGTSIEKTEETVLSIQEKVFELKQQYANEGEPDLFRHILVSVGEQPFKKRQSTNRGGGTSGLDGSHLAEINIELQKSEYRQTGSEAIANRLRELVGTIPDAVELSFTSSIFSTGLPLNIEFSGNNYEALNNIADEMKAHLATYAGVFDITDSYRAGKKEMKLNITPQAQAAGLTLSDLARQVRQAFYGEEAQRIQRNRDDVKVMVRFPKSNRHSVEDLEKLRIRLPNGTNVPFVEAATVEHGRGYASISRRNRRRTLSVMADVNDKVTTAETVIKSVEAEFLPDLMKKYPDIHYSLEGEQETQRETMAGLGFGFSIAMLVIYVLLAIPFKSYIQPFIVMSAIPFGVIGAIWGHVLLGYGLTILSMFGIVALSGVVVNDSLVMVDFINRARRDGMELEEAIKTAGARRFRPILLTSVTTFLGLTPLLFETSVQAQFLIPMAISLGFGVLFATFISLILVPVIYRTQVDFKNLFTRKNKETEAASYQQA